MGTHVRTLLEAKGTSVETITPTASITEATARLARHRIGALVVSADGTTVDGILSERDVIGRLASSGSACLDLQVGQVMTASVTTCTPEDTTDHLMRLMTQGRFRHVPVVEEDRLVGLVSIGDVVKARINELETATASLEDYVTGSGY